MPRHNDNPEWTKDDFDKAKPFGDLFPEQQRSLRKRGRPPVTVPNVHIGFRMSADIVERIRATGRGYNARVEEVLREALENGRF